MAQNFSSSTQKNFDVFLQQDRIAISMVLIHFCARLSGVSEIKENPASRLESYFRYAVNKKLKRTVSCYVGFLLSFCCTELIFVVWTGRFFYE
jgi:hypothetical protein